MIAMNRLFLLLSGFIFLQGCSHTCSDDAEKKIMGKLYKKQMNIPVDWKLMNENYIGPNNRFDVFKNGQDLFVLHYFLANCDRCIEELMEARKFIQKNQARFPRLKYVFVGTGVVDVFIRDAIMKSKFEYPVYFEPKYMEFKKSNNFPVDDDLYNTMLIGKKDELLLLGSFFDNTQAQDLYSDILNCSYHE